MITSASNPSAYRACRPAWTTWLQSGIISRRRTASHLQALNNPDYLLNYVGTVRLLPLLLQVKCRVRYTVHCTNASCAQIQELCASRGRPPPEYIVRAQGKEYQDHKQGLLFESWEAGRIYLRLTLLLWSRLGCWPMSGCSDWTEEKEPLWNAHFQANPTPAHGLLLPQLCTASNRWKQRVWDKVKKLLSR